jgi:superfamily II DNA or RNA helicase
MRLSFVPKEPDKAYIADRLWLPRGGIRVEPVKRALEFTVNSQGGQTKMQMWDESSNHILCPREFLPSSNYRHYRFPFVDLRPQFQRLHFEDKIEPRNEEQQRAWRALAANDNGILNLGCGKGKTVLALKKIAQRGMPTLVVVPDGGILEQWKEAVLGNKVTGRPPGLEFDGELGLIQGPVFNWAKPLTLALVTTLWMRIQEGAIPEEMFRYFGLIVYDEVHGIGAPKFSLTATPFYGDRIGLTATVMREDGLDPIYRYHIGEPFYTDLVQDLVPRIYFQKTPVVIDYEKAKLDGQQTNVSVLRTILGRDYSANVYRYWAIKDALDAGRKILCLSHSKDQLRLFHALFPDSALIIAETERSERMGILRDSQICFAISRLGSVGVDDPSLDTLFWLTPFRSKNALQQSMGRIQRLLPDKKTPVMNVFEDWFTPTIKKMCAKLKSSLREWGYEYENLKPSPYPKDFPPEVRELYVRAFEQLPPRSRDDGEEEGGD